MSTDSAAGRLLAILQRAKQMSGVTTIGAAWSEILGVPPNDTPLVLRRVGFLIQLPSQVREEAQRLAGVVDPNVLLSELHRIESALFSLDFGAQLSSVTKQITDAALFGLQMCDDMLSKLDDEVGLSPDTREHLVEEVAELMRTVYSADIAADLKAFLMDRLARMREAIQDYDLAGMDSIRTAVTQAVTAAALRPDLWKRSRETSVGARVWDFLNRVGIIVGLVGGIPQIASQVVAMLPESLPGQEQPAPDLPARPQNRDSIILPKEPSLESADGPDEAPPE